MTLSSLPRKDPRRRSRVPTLPPSGRSRAALGLDAAAAQGRLALQSCAECGAVQYPARDACAMCLSSRLEWRDQPPGGMVVGISTIRISQEPYFRERAPWRVGLVRADAGVTVKAHLHTAVERGARVRLSLRLDKAGRGVMVALPEAGPMAASTAEDPRMSAFSCDPRGRRVLVVDGTAPTGTALVRALLEAGAALVLVGEPEVWMRHPARNALEGTERVQMLPLDVTDETSLRKALGAIGGKVDVLIDNSTHERPGDLMTRPDTVAARQEAEVLWLGLLRLAQVFGPVLRARGLDEPVSASAWVSLISSSAIAPEAGWAAQSAVQAARLSATRSLRAEMRSGGVRVAEAFHGPLDHEWRQGVPPPLLSPAQVARAVVEMLQAGHEEVWIGDVARDIRDRWRADPGLYEREALEAFRR